MLKALDPCSVFKFTSSYVNLVHSLRTVGFGWGGGWVDGGGLDGLHWKLWLVLWRQAGLGNPRQINHTAGASARVRTDYVLFTAESAHLFWVQLKDP